MLMAASRNLRLCGLIHAAAACCFPSAAGRHYSATIHEIRAVVGGGDGEWRPILTADAASAQDVCPPRAPIPKYMPQTAPFFTVQTAAGGAPLLYARARAMKLFATAPEEDHGQLPPEAKKGVTEPRKAWTWHMDCASAPRPSLHAYTNPSHKRSQAPRPDSAGSTWLTTASCFPATAAAVAGGDGVERPCFRAVYDGWIRLPTTVASPMDTRVDWDHRAGGNARPAAFHDATDWGAAADASYTEQVLAIFASEFNLTALRRTNSRHKVYDTVGEGTNLNVSYNPRGWDCLHADHLADPDFKFSAVLYLGMSDDLEGATPLIETPYTSCTILAS